MRLRTKVTLLFGLIALVATVSLTVVTYAFARSSLLEQRLDAARAQAIANAQRVRDQLRFADIDSVRDFFVSGQIRTDEDGFAFMRLSGDPGDVATTDSRVTEESFPLQLRSMAEGSQSGLQIYDIEGQHYVAAGIHIGEFDKTYYEAFPLGSTESNLSAILLALVTGSIITILLAAAAGWWTSRRLLRPLDRITAVAGEIAAGSLDTRVALEGDPDLDRLAESFNEMADTVQTRIEREARFASDVSHELRSPITALAAAAEVIHGRRGELPDRTQQALDVVVGQVRRFDSMVIDLLELSRIDAGATDLHLEEVDLVALCRRVAARNGFADLPIVLADRAPTRALIDKLRFERILANLLENADHHGGGPLRISIEPADGPYGLVAVEDAGPGVARGERARIFERFARGSAARHRIGTGLGLALVAEHAAAQGGEAWVEDRNGGGARFVVRLPMGDGA
jgi:signal transduction histidine kinase